MIQHLAISAFKSLASAELNLGTFNLLIGPNGAGKSNLMEAVGVLSAAASGRVDDESLLRRGVRPGVPALYKTSFAGSKMKNAIDLTAQCGRLTYKVGLHNPVHSPRPAWSFKTESFRDGGVLIFGRSPRSTPRLNQYEGLLALKAIEFEEDTDPYDFVRSLQNYAIFSPNTPTLRGLVSDPQSREPVGLNGGRLAEGYRELLRGPSRAPVTAARKELIDWVGSINIGPSEHLVSSSVATPPSALRFRDKFMAEGRDSLTAYDASEGALYVVFALVLCFHPAAPDVVAIDNFDHALNPLLAKRLTNVIANAILADSRDRQIFLTAHNPLVLDGLPLGDDRVRLFTVSRSERGRTVVRRITITDQMRQMVFEDGWTLSRMWTAGYLGGVPSV